LSVRSCREQKVERSMIGTCGIRDGRGETTHYLLRGSPISMRSILMQG
jgi:hypothetical protein